MKKKNPMTLVCHQWDLGETIAYGIMAVICFKYYFQEHEWLKGNCNIKRPYQNKWWLANVSLKNSFVHITVLPTYMINMKKVRIWYWITMNWNYILLWVGCEYGELNLIPLQEHQMFLTAEPFLHPKSGVLEALNSFQAVRQDSSESLITV